MVLLGKLPRFLFYFCFIFIFYFYFLFLFIFIFIFVFRFVLSFPAILMTRSITYLFYLLFSLSLTKFWRVNNALSVPLTPTLSHLPPSLTLSSRNTPNTPSSLPLKKNNCLFFALLLGGPSFPLSLFPVISMIGLPSTGILLSRLEDLLGLGAVCY